MQGTTTEAVAPAAPAAYLVGGQRFRPDSAGFVEAIAAAHAEHHRPLCLCWQGGIEMYVARLGDGFIVKRMPNTGSQHAPDCPSYEPPPEFSGLGQVLGSAITEDSATGETTLKLGFPMSKICGRSTIPTSGSASNSVVSDGTKLSLRGLLHFLWDQAELTRWHPGFAGRRTWATVRRHLLQAAETMIARGGALDARLYIPEVFSVAQRYAIDARRVAQWARAAATPGKPQPLMLLIAEVKEIVPARYGFKAVIKHLPDQAFAIDESLYRRLVRTFEPELSMWGAMDSLHMVMVATFGVGSTGVPSISELSLMPATAQWIPVEDALGHHLLETLVREGRCFIKGLRYNLSAEVLLASAVLTDAGTSAVPLYIAPRNGPNGGTGHALWNLESIDMHSAWVWNSAQGPMPPIPPPGAALTRQVPLIGRSGTRDRNELSLDGGQLPYPATQPPHIHSPSS